MPRRETFDALLRKTLPIGETFEAFAARIGVSSRVLRVWRTKGSQRPFHATISKVAAGLGVEAARVLAAVLANQARQ